MREAGIVSAAEEVFFEKSFDMASMEEIAKRAQFTKRTIYQYFMGKEDLYYAVANKNFRTLLDYFREALAIDGTGYEKYRASTMAYYRFYRDHPKALALMNYGRFIQGQKELCPHFQEMIRLNRGMIEMFVEVLEEGKRDGSIRADLDTHKGVCSGVYLVVGFFQLLSEKGTHLTKYHGIDVEEFVEYTIDLICDAVREK